MAERNQPEPVPVDTDEEANTALTRGNKREEEEEEARDIVGGFRRSESAEPIDVALKEAEKENKGQ